MRQRGVFLVRLSGCVFLSEIRLHNGPKGGMRALLHTPCRPTDQHVSTWFGRQFLRECRAEYDDQWRVHLTPAFSVETDHVRAHHQNLQLLVRRARYHTHCMFSEGLREKRLNSNIFSTPAEINPQGFHNQKLWRFCHLYAQGRRFKRLHAHRSTVSPRRVPFVPC